METRQIERISVITRFSDAENIAWCVNAAVEKRGGQSAPERDVPRRAPALPGAYRKSRTYCFDPGKPHDWCKCPGGRVIQAMPRNPSAGGII